MVTCPGLAPRFDRSRASCGYEYICGMPRASILVKFLATSNTRLPDRTCLGIRMWLLFQPWQTFLMLAAEIAPLQKFNVRKAKRGVRDSYPLLVTAVATKLLEPEAHFWALSCGPGDLKTDVICETLALGLGLRVSAELEGVSRAALSGSTCSSSPIASSFNKHSSCARDC